MSSKPINVAALILIMLSYGCGKKKSDSNSIDGTWKSSCLSASGVYATDTLVFNGNNLTEMVSSYTDSGCTQIADTITATFTLVITAVNTVPPYNHIDATIVSIQNLPATSAAATNYNNISFCGFTNWAVGVPQEIAGISSCGIKASGTTIHQVYAINTSVNGSTASTNTINIGQGFSGNGPDFYDQAANSGYPFTLMAGGYQRQ